jgi:hypothetical protein
MVISCSSSKGASVLKIQGTLNNSILLHLFAWAVSIFHLPSDDCALVLSEFPCKAEHAVDRKAS